MDFINPNPLVFFRDFTGKRPAAYAVEELRWGSARAYIQLQGVTQFIMKPGAKPKPEVAPWTPESHPRRDASEFNGPPTEQKGKNVKNNF